MGRYLGQKLTYLVLTLAAVLVTNFVLFHLMPGDPVTHIARGQHLDAAAVARLRAFYGLDRPMFDQFLTYVGHLARGDLGYSYTYQTSVGPIVVKALGNTLILVTVSTLLVIGLGVLVGVFAASRRGSQSSRASGRRQVCRSSRARTPGRAGSCSRGPCACRRPSSRSRSRRACRRWTG